MDSKVIKLVSDLVGIPFVDRGRTLAGVDCWGLCMLVFHRFGYELPEYPIGAFECAQIHQAIMQDRQIWQELKEPQAPCLVIMRLGGKDFVNHCGIYLGKRLMLHTRSKTGSVIEKIDKPIFKPLIKGFLAAPGEYKRK
jgi:cell wall-associated NlpC family hydrolase